VVDSTLNSFDIGFVPDPFSSCEVPFTKKKRLKFLVKISQKSSDVRASNDFTRVGFGQKKNNSAKFENCQNRSCCIPGPIRALLAQSVGDARSA
jgi:hypothetical protein